MNTQEKDPTSPRHSIIQIDLGDEVAIIAFRFTDCYFIMADKELTLDEIESLMAKSIKDTV